MRLSIQEVLTFKQEIEEIKQLMLRLGWIKPPKPYSIQFERRSQLRNSMRLEDCCGFNVRRES